VTPAEVTRLVARVGSLWPNWKMPASDAAMAVLVDEWSAMLEDVSAHAATVTVRRAALAGEAFPPPVGRIVVEAKAGADAGGPPDGDAAWAEVRSAIARHGWVEPPDYRGDRFGVRQWTWTHPAIGAAVEALGGWPYVCESTNEVADRAHFLRLYGEARARHRVDVALPPTTRALAAGLAGALALEAPGDA
jgi:hypothetical protein